MRERAAQKLNPKIGRMGAEDPLRAFPAAPLAEVDRRQRPPFDLEPEKVRPPIVARHVQRPLRG